MKALHLVRRAIGSIRNNPIDATESRVAESVLLSAEFELWGRMQHRDQRHSLVVLRRFADAYPQASRDEKAAALLHDVGKAFSDLGWCARIAATLVGPRTSRFAAYLDHEAIGNEALTGVSTSRTLEVLVGDVDDACVAALRRADDI